LDLFQVSVDVRYSLSKNASKLLKDKESKKIVRELNLFEYSNIESFFPVGSYCGEKINSLRPLK